MRILVVDDEPLVAQTLAIIFRKHGFEAATVASVEEAMTSVRSLAPDLLICDIDMPGRDGVSLMQQVGVEFPALPILVLTGFYSALGRVSDCALTLRQPVSICTKPCPPADLLRTADSMLHSRPPAHRIALS